MLKRTPIRRKAVAKKRKRTGPRCSWSNRCKRRPSIKVTPTGTNQGVDSPEQLYCKTHATTIADTLVGNYVKQRDGYVCVSCHREGEPMQWAHVHSRGARYIRWDPENSVCLCQSCHLRFTRAPAAWSVFVEAQWPCLWTRLIHREIAGEAKGGSVDIAAVIEAFRVAV